MGYKINDYLKPCYSILDNSVLWMESLGFNNPDSRDVVSYRAGHIAKTRVAYRDQDPATTSDEDLIKELTEDKYRIEFIKITKRISDKLMDSYNYTMPEISAPLIVDGGPVSAPNAKSCIFTPNSDLEIPLTNVSLDQSGWDMSGVTVNIGRFGDAKYTCDTLDEVETSVVNSSRYPVPMMYNDDPSVGVVLPDTGNIIDVNPDFVKAMSFFVFENRTVYKTTAIHARTHVPVFNGIYVTPLVMLYYQMVEFRDRSLALQ